MSGTIADRPAFAVLLAAGSGLSPAPPLIQRRTIITTGSHAGLLRGSPGDTVNAHFGGYGRLIVSFEA